MPFIIWGSRGITSTLENGTFTCPRCNAEADYELKQVRPFFTLFFIPIFPIGGGQRYVECCQCRNQYLEEILTMPPPTAEERLLGQFFSELQTGSSVEMVQKKLEAAGLAGGEAQNIMDQFTQGQTWRCQSCGDTYLNSVRKCLRCRT